jgi:hypothetical protein
MNLLKKKITIDPKKKCEIVKQIKIANNKIFESNINLDNAIKERDNNEEFKRLQKNIDEAEKERRNAFSNYIKTRDSLLNEYSEEIQNMIRALSTL